MRFDQEYRLDEGSEPPFPVWDSTPQNRENLTSVAVGRESDDARWNPYLVYDSEADMSTIYMIHKEQGSSMGVFDYLKDHPDDIDTISELSAYHESQKGKMSHQAAASQAEMMEINADQAIIDHYFSKQTQLMLRDCGFRIQDLHFGMDEMEMAADLINTNPDFPVLQFEIDSRNPERSLIEEYLANDTNLPEEYANTKEMRAVREQFQELLHQNQTRQEPEAPEQEPIDEPERSSTIESEQHLNHDGEAERTTDRGSETEFKEEPESEFEEPDVTQEKSESGKPEQEKTEKPKQEKTEPEQTEPEREKTEKSEPEKTGSEQEKTEPEPEKIEPGPEKSGPEPEKTEPEPEKDPQKEKGNSLASKIAEFLRDTSKKVDHYADSRRYADIKEQDVEKDSNQTQDRKVVDNGVRVTAAMAASRLLKQGAKAADFADHPSYDAVKEKGKELGSSAGHVFHTHLKNAEKNKNYDEAMRIVNELGKERTFEFNDGNTYTFIPQKKMNKMIDEAEKKDPKILKNGKPISQRKAKAGFLSQQKYFFSQIGMLLRGDDKENREISNRDLESMGIPKDVYDQLKDKALKEQQIVGTSFVDRFGQKHTITITPSTLATPEANAFDDHDPDVNIELDGKQTTKENAISAIANIAKENTKALGKGSIIAAGLTLGTAKRGISAARKGWSLLNEIAEMGMSR